MRKKAVERRHTLRLGWAGVRRIVYDEEEQRIEVMSPRVGAKEACNVSVNLMHCELIADFIQCEPQRYRNESAPPEYWLSVLFILFLGRVDCSDLPDDLLAPADGLGRAANIQTLQEFEKRIGGEELTQARCHRFFDSLALAEKAKAGRLMWPGLWSSCFINGLVIALPYGFNSSWVARPILSGLLRLFTWRIIALSVDKGQRDSSLSFSELRAAGRVAGMSLLCHGALFLASETRFLSALSLAPVYGLPCWLVES
jgi:hypothetical protein